MKTIFSILFTVFLISSCGQKVAQESSTEAAVSNEPESKVMVYYFHGKQRCPTCVAIQKVTEDAYSSLLSGNEEVNYKEIDISLKENEALAEKYEIVWSSLVIASANDHKNLTEQAFGLAVNRPEELKELIVKETNELLTKN
jgi:hypothetical protein